MAILAKGIGMDANFTYPIVLNTTLIQPPQPLWKEWLPVIVSILVVILGGLSTYYVTIVVERNKRQYELKKQIYFEALEVFSKYNRFISEDLDIAWSNPHYTEEVRDEFLIKFRILKLKLEFCGAPQQITSYISAIMDEMDEILEEKFKFDNTDRFIKETIQELKLDLLKSYGKPKAKHWWQFWK